LFSTLPSSTNTPFLGFFLLSLLHHFSSYFFLFFQKIKNLDNYLPYLPKALQLKTPHLQNNHQMSKPLSSHPPPNSSTTTRKTGKKKQRKKPVTSKLPENV
jgi:hypothetical protein